MDTEMAPVVPEEMSPAADCSRLRVPCSWQVTIRAGPQGDGDMGQQEGRGPQGQGHHQGRGPQGDGDVGQQEGRGPREKATWGSRRAEVPRARATIGAGP